MPKVIRPNRNTLVCHEVVGRSRGFFFFVLSWFFFSNSSDGAERRRTRVMRSDNYTLLEAAAVIRPCGVRRAAGPLLRKHLPLAVRARGEKKKEKKKASEVKTAFSSLPDVKRLQVQ